MKVFIAIMCGLLPWPVFAKTLAWDANNSAEHIAYYCVYMRLSSTSWARLGTTYDIQFSLPRGPYTRTFAVTAVNPELPGNLYESSKSAPITVSLY